MHHLELNKHQKIYIASDFHLGFPKGKASRERENKIVRWLDNISQDAALIILLGDIFDFWYEYKKAVPKGFVRLQGKIAELTDKGIPVVLFTGNHDLWMFGYFEQELGVKVYHTPQSVEWNEKNILLGHGDGLGNGDYAYKFLKKGLFTNPICRFLFEWLHPNIGISLAHLWSGSRKNTDLSKIAVEEYTSKQDEWIWQYCNEVHQKTPHHYYIFGHRHLPMCVNMSLDKTKIAPDLKHHLDTSARSYYLNTGEWMNHFTYIVFGIDNSSDNKSSFEFECKAFEANTAWIID